MEPARLYEQPFTNFSPMGLDGVFKDIEIDRLLSIVQTINGNAGMGAKTQLAKVNG